MHSHYGVALTRLVLNLLTCSLDDDTSWASVIYGESESNKCRILLLLLCCECSFCTTCALSVATLTFHCASCKTNKVIESCPTVLLFCFHTRSPWERSLRPGVMQSDHSMQCHLFAYSTFILGKGEWSSWLRASKWAPAVSALQSGPVRAP